MYYIDNPSARPNQMFFMVDMRFFFIHTVELLQSLSKWPAKQAKTAKTASQASQASQGSRDTMLLHFLFGFITFAATWQQTSEYYIGFIHVCGTNVAVAVVARRR